MVVCTVNNITKVCKYLGLQRLPEEDKREVVTDNNGAVAGFGNLVLKLGFRQASSTKHKFLGSTAMDEALVRQWVEYGVCTANYIDSSPIARRIFQELNAHLSRYTYLIGNKCTLADVVMYYLVSDAISKLSYQEKERYLHLSRWFNNLQQDGRIRGDTPTVVFSRTPLY